MCLSEALAGAVDAGEKFLGGNGGVEGLGRVEADVAIATRITIVAEIAQQHLPATLAGFGKTQQRIELAVLRPFAWVGSLRFVDETAAQRDVFRAIEHQDFSGRAVAAGATG